MGERVIATKRMYEQMMMQVGCSNEQDMVR
jgi:hypothetical protein